MAKASTDFLRFLCGRCRTKLRVSMKLAGKFMNCPKCSQRTPIPYTQEEADSDAVDYSVQKQFYETPEKCTKCGKKLAKGTVLCTNCGFDYRAGKQLLTSDYTVKTGDKIRGGPALQSAIAAIVLVAIDSGFFVWRLLEDKKLWWEQALYLTFLLFLVGSVPMLFIQWYGYRGTAIRDHSEVKIEDRAERMEAMQPFGDWTGLVFFLCLLTAFGIMFFLFSRDDAGKLIIPFMSET